MPGPRIALVLSAGGLRGAAHAGVLRRLVDGGVPVHAIVGVSAGAVTAAYYAAVGLSVDELVHDAVLLRGRHLLAHSLNVHLNGRFNVRFARWCGVIPERLRQLEGASFDRLHHGIRRLGIVCHDVRSGRPHYFSSSSSDDVSLGEAVRASASIPHLFPTISVASNRGILDLTDGGISDPVPIAFARSAAIGATHVIVSDCRWIGRVPAAAPATVWIRPRMVHAGTLWSPRGGLSSVVVAGETAVTDSVLRRIREWLGTTRPETQAISPAVPVDAR